MKGVTIHAGVCKKEPCPCSGLGLVLLRLVIFGEAFPLAPWPQPPVCCLLETLAFLLTLLPSVFLSCLHPERKTAGQLPSSLKVVIELCPLSFPSICTELCHLLGIRGTVSVGKLITAAESAASAPSWRQVASGLMNTVKKKRRRRRARKEGRRDYMKMIFF